MKVKIKSFNGELPEYLTKGKVYKGKPILNGVTFVDDHGHKIYVHLLNSAHLNGGSWEIVG